MKLDIGAGRNPLEGFKSVDVVAFDGVDYIFDAGKDIWPFEDGSIEEVYSSHCIEHMDAEERVHFCNEMYRVLIPDGKATLVVPHWCSCRATGDPTHKWPPVSEYWLFYLSREWRLQRVPHTDKTYWDKGFDCDFEASWNYILHPKVQERNEADQDFALMFYKEAAQDMIAKLRKL